jgi:hypothetical protein
MKNEPNTVVIKRGSPELKSFIRDIAYKLKQGQVIPVNLEGTIFVVSFDSETQKLSIVPKKTTIQTLSSGLVFIY